MSQLCKCSVILYRPHLNSLLCKTSLDKSLLDSCKLRLDQWALFPPPKVFHGLALDAAEDALRSTVLTAFIFFTSSTAPLTTCGCCPSQRSLRMVTFEVKGTHNLQLIIFSLFCAWFLLTSVVPLPLLGPQPSALPMASFARAQFTKLHSVTRTRTGC
jgi:hypothetical protein